MTDWEGGERQGIRWRRAGLVLLVVAVVAGGIYVIRRDRGISIDTDGAPVVGASETVDVVVVAPLRAGARWYCPDSYPVRVHADGRYYPGEYPRGYDLVDQPESCYADVERAIQDGFRLAPPPEGVDVAGGVYLEDTSSPTLSACRLMASYASHVMDHVPCPTRLPTPAIGASCGQDSCVYGDADGDFGIIIEQREFREPPDWPTDTPHIVIAAVGLTRNRDDEFAAITYPELVSCASDTAAPNDNVPTFVECPAGETWVPRLQGEPHEGHTAAFWRRGKTAYGVSVEGYGPQVRALLEAVIDGLTFVRVG